ncbi:hypothetical protein OH76DRAFT_205590 [Lentinus brumalis]|uniref:Uncharacterized protein n=1 Tax=Lentinus brumalis TaxID=2498619 RepID=A0A371DIG5_9APHY|nr:hypothetical protein OH76DRAFT_205590 [Polyporus brumalis]
MDCISNVFNDVGLNNEPRQLYPITVKGQRGLRISDGALKTQKSMCNSGFDQCTININDRLNAKNGRPVRLHRVQSLSRTDQSLDVDYSYELNLSSSGRPLTLGHIVYQFVQAQWQDYKERTMKQDILTMRTRQEGTREDLGASAPLIPPEELYIVAIMHKIVDGVERWYPEIEPKTFELWNIDTQPVS